MHVHVCVLYMWMFVCVLVNISSCLLLGNMFSSCRGHLFDWSLSLAGEQEPEDVIRYSNVF